MRLAATTAVLALLAGALPASAQEWHEAYRSGLAALARGRAAEAVERLERAARLHPEPGDNIVTYGTNIEPRYHPYLRLAEAYLKLGHPEAARAALQRSERWNREPAAERARLDALVEAALRAAGPAPPSPTPSAPSPPPTAVPAPTPSPPPTTVPATGTLELRSQPSAAAVFLGDEPFGETPLVATLTPGDYPITLRREGSVPQSFRVSIEAGRRSVVNKVLAPSRPTAKAAETAVPSRSAPMPAPATPTAPSALSRPATGGLEVFSDPPGASAYVDDEWLGETHPVTGRLVRQGIEPGRHRLRVARAGHADAYRDVEVAPGAPTTVRVTLEFAAAADAPPAIGPATIVAALALGALAVFARVWWRRPTHGAVLTTGRRGRPATPGRHVRTPLRAPTPSRSAYGSGEADGETFGDYRLLDVLGRGGMAVVFSAERRGERVALKRPLDTLLDDPEFLERFLRETEIGRTLYHPNIVRVLDQGEIDGVPYFTMDLIEGETLQEHLRRLGRLEARPATALVMQVAQALDYAHLKGVVHRDLKPSNIMVLDDGGVKVADYGIARAGRFQGLTVTGAFLGSPDYVAPETVERGGGDARSDLYSLGVVFYEVLTGRRPFEGDSALAVLRAHATEPPLPPSAAAPEVPLELDAIVLRLLAKRPEDRFASAEELLAALREFLSRAA